MKHLLTIKSLDAGRFHDLVAVATYLKRRRAQGISEHALARKTLAMIFEKPSLRTRLSFEQAMLELGGQAMYIRGEEIGIGKREAIQDIARVLGRYVHGIMARVFRHQTVQDLATWAGVPVVNGLCNLAHPCQALGDFLTIQEQFGTLRGLRIVFIGDANNVCRSLASACVHTGSTLVLACPPGYGFSPEKRAELGSHWGTVVTECADPVAAVAGAHVLYSDVWTSMGQEAEQQQRLKDFQGFTIDGRLIAAAGPDCRIMHCLPAHRGEEITDEAMEHPRSVVFDQAENRLHAQKAILRLLMGPEPEAVIAAANS